MRFFITLSREIFPPVVTLLKLARSERVFLEKKPFSHLILWQGRREMFATPSHRALSCLLLFEFFHNSTGIHWTSEKEGILF